MAHLLLLLLLLLRPPALLLLLASAATYVGEAASTAQVCAFRALPPLAEQHTPSRRLCNGLWRVPGSYRGLLRGWAGICPPRSAAAAAAA